MANSMSQYRQNGVDYIIDDPTTAQVFVETAAYTAGTYVKHQGNMYRFTTDHAAGAWNASEVTQVTLGQEVSDLKSALSDSISLGVIYFHDWRNGGMSSKGALVDTYQYRLATTRILQIPYETTLTILPGFRIIVAYFKDGVFDSSSGWVSGTYAVPENSNVRIQLARTIEDTSEIASIKVFKQQLYYSTRIATKQDDLSYRLQMIEDGKIGFDAMFIRGDIINGKMDTSKVNRVITQNLIFFTEDSDFIISDGYRAYIFFYDESLNLTESVGWLTNTINIKSGSNIRLLIAKIDETSEIADVEEFSKAIFTYLTSDDYHDYCLKAAIKYNTKPITSEWVSGGCNSKGVLNNLYSYRVATKRVLHFKETTTIEVCEGFRFYLYYFSNNTFSESDGWHTDKVDIPSGTYVRIQIARVKEDTSENADESLFGSMLGIVGVDESKKAVDRLHTFSLLQSATILNVAHRGNDWLAPENTMSAFYAAKMIGFPYIETDIRWTSDDEMVLLHDATLDRTSNGSGNVSDYTLADLRKLDFGSWFSPNFTGELIPTLEEFLVFCKETGTHPWLEIKDVLGEQTDARLQKMHEMLSRLDLLNADLYFVNGDPTYVPKVADKFPMAFVGWTLNNITEDHVSWVVNQRKNHSRENIFLFPDYSKITSSVVDLAAENEVKIATWTLNYDSNMPNVNPYVFAIICGRNCIPAIYYSNKYHTKLAI